jgi:3-phenylpropionate/trans-cinnamate dioxygenase ferredoxin component
LQNWEAPNEQQLPYANFPKLNRAKFASSLLTVAAIAVVRIDDARCTQLATRCSHADVSLSDGDVLCDSKELECIKHGSAFSLVTGVPNTLPATQPVPVYEASVVNGEVMISVGVAK